MSTVAMQLKILMPHALFAEVSGVLSMVAETQYGALGILPQRLDCVAVLSPGIFSYSSEAEGEMFVALDEGVLVKTGRDVLVSTRRAVGGKDLATLHTLVEEEFRVLDEQEKDIHAAMVKMESGFLRRFATFEHR